MSENRKREQLFTLTSSEINNSIFDLDHLISLIDQGEIEAAKQFIFDQVKERWQAYKALSQNMIDKDQMDYPELRNFSTKKDYEQYRQEQGLTGLSPRDLTSTERRFHNRVSRYLTNLLELNVIIPNVLIYLDWLKTNSYDQLFALELASAARQARWLVRHHTNFAEHYSDSDQDKKREIKSNNLKAASDAQKFAEYFILATRVFSPQSAEDLLFLDEDPILPDVDNDEEEGGSLSPVGLLPIRFSRHGIFSPSIYPDENLSARDPGWSKNRRNTG